MNKMIFAAAAFSVLSVPAFASAPQAATTKSSVTAKSAIPARTAVRTTSVKAAAAPAKAPTARAPVAPAKPPMMSRMFGRSNAAAPAPRGVAHNRAAGRMVTTKTSTGKTITYNCSLAGNRDKKACK